MAPRSLSTPVCAHLVRITAAHCDRVVRMMLGRIKPTNVLALAIPIFPERVQKGVDEHQTGALSQIVHLMIEMRYFEIKIRAECCIITHYDMSTLKVIPS